MAAEVVVIFGAVFMIFNVFSVDGADIVVLLDCLLQVLIGVLCFGLNAKKPRPWRARLGSFEDSEGLVVFRGACEDSTGRWIAPIGAGKKHVLETSRHAG